MTATECIFLIYFSSLFFSGRLFDSHCRSFSAFIIIIII